jgi:hypothetical protein
MKKKLIDEKHGIGNLTKEGHALHDVTYRISVYQEFHEPSPRERPPAGTKDIHGHVTFHEDVDSFDLMGQDFALLLEDGTRMDLQLGENGKILTRKSFY